LLYSFTANDYRGDGRLVTSKPSLSHLHEAHRSRVHTVAQTGWTGAVIEDVAEVGIALPAGDSRALHAQAHIVYLDDVLFRDRLPETWPARTGFKLRLRAENGVVAANAAIETVVVVVPGAAGIGTLRACTTGHFEGDGSELLLPVRVGANDLRNYDLTGRLARIRKLDDGHSPGTPSSPTSYGSEGWTPCSESGYTAGTGCCNEKRATIRTW